MKIYQMPAIIPWIGAIMLLLAGFAEAREEGGSLPVHFKKLSPELYSGATPGNHFAALYEKGIRTVLSVDGATPNVEEARKAGLRYVHLPIGYAGVSPRVQATLAKLMKEAPGPIYIHCHHGLHRGPSVAALMAIHRKTYTREQALAYMAQVGTGKQYTGLWKTVRTFEDFPTDVRPMALLEVSPVDDLTAAMVKIDDAYDYIKLLAKQASQPQQADQPHEEFSHQSLLLAEYFRESARHLTKEQMVMKPHLKEAEKMSMQLRKALDQKQYSLIPGHLKSLKTSCVDCHQDHRD